MVAGPEMLGEVLTIPSRFVVCERLVPETLGSVPEALAWIKDYDLFEADRPDRLPLRYDVGCWGVLLARSGDLLVGAMVLAWRTPGFEPLDSRDDLVWVVDLRVLPNFQGGGIGTMLWGAAERWAEERGAAEIRVETQDVNVPACRFYQSVGCDLLFADADAYGPDLDEARLIWGKRLG